METANEDVSFIMHVYNNGGLLDFNDDNDNNNTHNIMQMGVPPPPINEQNTYQWLVGLLIKCNKIIGETQTKWHWQVHCALFIRARKSVAYRFNSMSQHGHVGRGREQKSHPCSRKRRRGLTE